MKKLYIMGLIAVLLISAVFAGSYIFEVKNKTDFSDMKSQGSSARIPDKFLVTVDGKEIELNGTEPDGKYDDNDIVSLLSEVKGKITKLEWVGIGTYKENKYGDKGFDEEELKTKECTREGLSYNSKSNDCTELELGQIEG